MTLIKNSSKQERDGDKNLLISNFNDSNALKELLNLIYEKRKLIFKEKNLINIHNELIVPFHKQLNDLY